MLMGEGRVNTCFIYCEHVSIEKEKNIKLDMCVYEREHEHMFYPLNIILMNSIHL